MTRHFFFNQPKMANILQEQGELSELIHDYFMGEPCDDSGDEKQCVFELFRIPHGRICEMGDSTQLCQSRCVF